MEPRSASPMDDDKYWINLYLSTDTIPKERDSDGNIVMPSSKYIFYTCVTTPGCLFGRHEPEALNAPNAHLAPDIGKEIQAVCNGEDPPQWWNRTSPWFLAWERLDCLEEFCACAETLGWIPKLVP